MVAVPPVLLLESLQVGQLVLVVVVDELAVLGSRPQQLNQPVFGHVL